MKKLIILSALMALIIPSINKVSANSAWEFGRQVADTHREAFTISYCAMVNGKLTKSQTTPWTINYIKSKLGTRALRIQPTGAQIEMMISQMLDYYGDCNSVLRALGSSSFTLISS